MDEAPVRRSGAGKKGSGCSEDGLAGAWHHGHEGQTERVGAEAEMGEEAFDA